MTKTLRDESVKNFKRIGDGKERRRNKSTWVKKKRKKYKKSLREEDDLLEDKDIDEEVVESIR